MTALNAVQQSPCVGFAAHLTNVIAPNTLEEVLSTPSFVGSAVGFTM